MSENTVQWLFHTESLSWTVWRKIDSRSVEYLLQVRSCVNGDRWLCSDVIFSFRFDIVFTDRNASSIEIAHRSILQLFAPRGHKLQRFSPNLARPRGPCQISRTLGHIWEFLTPRHRKFKSLLTYLSSKDPPDLRWRIAPTLIQSITRYRVTSSECISRSCTALTNWRSVWHGMDQSVIDDAIDE